MNFTPSKMTCKYIVNKTQYNQYWRWIEALSDNNPILDEVVRAVCDKSQQYPAMPHYNFKTIDESSVITQKSWGKLKGILPIIKE